MALPAWPANLPFEPNMELYRVTAFGQPALASGMQSGRVRQRPQFTLRVATVNWGRFYSPEELAIWRNFIDVTLGKGTSRFTMQFYNAPTRAYVTKTAMIQGGAGGIAEEGVDGKELWQVSCVMLVEAF